MKVIATLKGAVKKYVGMMKIILMLVLSIKHYIIHKT